MFLRESTALFNINIYMHTNNNNGLNVTVIDLIYAVHQLRHTYVTEQRVTSIHISGRFRGGAQGARAPPFGKVKN